MKKIIAIIMAVFMMALAGCGKTIGQDAAGVQTTKAEASSGELVIKALDIGQGDALLIKSPEQVILIDTGDVGTREKIVSLLKKENVTTIDKLIITHPHADHLGGAYAVLNNFSVKEIYDNGQPTTNNTYRTYLKTLKKQNIKYHQLKAGDKLDFGNGISFNVFSPTAEEVAAGGDLNNNSIVGKLVYGSFSMLFTGDCEAEREKMILKKYAKELKSTVLKSPHHGSKTSSSKQFLKAAAPEAAVISCGLNNDYKHPHDITLKKYKEMNINIFRTDLSGTITIRTNGKTYDIKGEK